VIKPSIESIGVKLFKQMKRNAKIDSNYKENKVYGCEQPTNSTLNNDLPFCIYKPKSDFHGIGYKGISNDNNPNQSISSSGVSAVLSGGRKINISGEAFGYGVLEEDNEEDDAVVYHRDDMSQYDFAIGSMREKMNDRKKDKHKAIELLKTDTIKGFIKCSTKSDLLYLIMKKYPIPVLPKDWKPGSLTGVAQPKKSRWDQGNNQTESISVDNSSKSAPSKPPVLNANIRAVLLGQEVIHRQGVKQVEKEEQVEQQQVEQQQIQSSSHSNKEKTRENVKVAEKPLFGFWANKFTRSSAGVEESTLAGGLSDFKSNQKSVDSDKVEQQPNQTECVIERTIYEWHPDKLLCKRFNIPNPYPQFPDVVGIVTVGRTDVRNRTSQMTAKKNKPNIFDCLFQQQNVSNVSMVDSVSDTNVDIQTDSHVNDGHISDTKVNISDNISNKEEEDNDETTRPPMDLFKAIFASDEEESEDESKNNDNEDDNNNNNNSIDNKSIDNSNTDKIVNQINTTKASGIFANIDFDQLNRNFTPILKSNDIPDPQSSQTNQSLTDHNVEPINDDFYGPALPPTLSLQTNVHKDLNIKSSKRKKKDKKHKKHKKQSSTHKKHKRHRRSSSSSLSSDGNVDIKIIQYLKKARK